MKSKIPFVTAPKFKEEAAYIQLKHPLTNKDIYITGISKTLYSALFQHKGLRFGEILEHILAAQPDLDESVLMEHMNKLLELNLVRLEDADEW